MRFFFGRPCLPLFDNAQLDFLGRMQSAIATDTFFRWRFCATCSRAADSILAKSDRCRQFSIGAGLILVDYSNRALSRRDITGITAAHSTLHAVEH
jgi:hypothetical protein